MPREGIAESRYYAWPKKFLEAGKRRLAGDTARAATTDEVKTLRQEARSLKEVVAEQALGLRLLKKLGRQSRLAWRVEGDSLRCPLEARDGDVPWRRGMAGSW